MSTRGSATRERILEVAESIILKQGFNGTSIDDILKGAHITKGGFFYHFDGKTELAVGLMNRYRVNDRIFFEGLFAQASELVEDPLQQMLLFLKFLADAFRNLPDVHPGCLVATFTYESDKVNDEVKTINREVILEWQEMFKRQLDCINTRYSPRIPTDADSLAHTLSTVVEGGIIISKALDEQDVLADQILHYRDYIRLLYNAA